jgi:lysozyme family protein
MADYKNIISFIKTKEGGKSSATTDTASRNPSPCGNGSNGKPYHTNKGVTWSTFSSNASSLGYSASCSNFLNMPDEIWGKIYKQSYWNPMQGDRIKNQAIANTFVEMAWGSGIGGATKFLKQFFTKYYNKSFDNITQIVDYVNKLDNEGKSPELFEKLYDFRGDKYVSLNQPSNLKGWMNRLDSFYALNKRYAISKKETGALVLVIGIGLIALGGAYIYVRTRRK